MMRVGVSFGLKLFLIVATITGCDTFRDTVPRLSGAPRTGLILEAPALVAVIDGRAKAEARDVIAPLEGDIRRIYGASLEWADYFGKTPTGRVAIRIRIVTLGATFGSRMISSTGFATAAGAAQLNATGAWGLVAGSVIAQQTVLAGSISGEGWWNGAAWADLAVEDLRRSTAVRFTLPIAAEHRESNMLGYVSADRAAQAAWNSVAAQLTRALDAILLHLRDDRGDRLSRSADRDIVVESNGQAT